MTDIELAILVRGFEDEMLKLAGERASSLALEKNAGFMDSLRGLFRAAPAVSPRAMSSLAGARPARLAPRVGYQSPGGLTRAQQLQADYMKRTGKTPLQAAQEQMSSTRGTDPSVYSDMTGLNPALARRLGAKTF